MPSWMGGALWPSHHHGSACMHSSADIIPPPPHLRCARLTFQPLLFRACTTAAGAVSPSLYSHPIAATLRNPRPWAVGSRECSCVTPRCERCVGLPLWEAAVRGPSGGVRPGGRGASSHCHWLIIRKKWLSRSAERPALLRCYQRSQRLRRTSTSACDRHVKYRHGMPTASS